MDAWCYGMTVGFIEMSKQFYFVSEICQHLKRVDTKMLATTG